MDQPAGTPGNINPFLPASPGPSYASVEQSGQYDRARLAYFSNRNLVFQILGNAANTVIFTVPANMVILIRSMWVFNNAGGATTFYYKILPSGIAAAAWLPKYEDAVATKTTVEWAQQDDVLESGSQILAWGSTANDLLLKVNGAYVVAQ